MRRLGRAVRNLIENSLRVSPPGGRVEVQLSAEARQDAGGTQHVRGSSLGLQLSASLDEEIEIALQPPVVGVELESLPAPCHRDVHGIEMPGGDGGEHHAQPLVRLVDEAALPVDDATEPCDDDRVGARVRVFNRQQMDLIESTGKVVLAACGEGDTLRTSLMFLKRLAKYEPVNSIELRRQIAARILATERYSY